VGSTPRLVLPGPASSSKTLPAPTARERPFFVYPYRGGSGSWGVCGCTPGSSQRGWLNGSGSTGG
jgi:hypothetical protein